MALLQLTVIPLGTSSASVGDYVTDIYKEVTAAGLSCQLNDMGTLIQGNIDELLAVVRKVYDLPFERGAQRVVTQIVIDDRRDKEVSIGDKITAIQGRMSNGA